MSPAVSIIMTVRNGARYLPETLDAIGRQTFGNFELVVNDNGSSDETPQILERSAARDPRIRLLAPPQDGASRTFTQGIGRALHAARAPLVAVNDCDDVPLPTRLERQVELFDTAPELVLVGCWYDNIDADGHQIVSHRLPVEHQHLVDLYQDRNAVAHSSLMYRRDAALAAGGYQERFTYASDFALQVAMLARGGRIAVVPETLTKIRIHEGQTSLMPGRRAQAYREPLEIHAAASRLPGLSPRARLLSVFTRQKLALRFGAALWDEGRRIEAVHRTVRGLFGPLSTLLTFGGGERHVQTEHRAVGGTS